MKFTIRHTLETDKKTYWDRVFFDPDFNRRLYRDALGFGAFEVLSETGAPGEARTRRMRTEPKSEAPAVVKKLLGDGISYIEDGRWDPETGVWTYQITTSRLSDKMRIGGRFWVEPRGEKKIERLCECDVEVKIALVGGAVEGFIEKTTRESYDAAARFTNQFIREKQLDR